MNSVADVWNSVLGILREDMSSVAVETWFSDAEAVDLKENVLVIHVPSDFKRAMIRQRFMDKLQDALSQIFAAPMELDLLSDEERAMLDGTHELYGKEEKKDAAEKS